MVKQNEADSLSVVASCLANDWAFSKGYCSSVSRVGAGVGGKGLGFVKVMSVVVMSLPIHYPSASFKAGR